MRGSSAAAAGSVLSFRSWSGLPERPVSSRHAGAILTIDLGAIVANYRRLQSELAEVECAAVVKADAYGLGVAHVAPVLERSGCRH